MVYVLKILNAFFFLFSNQILGFKAGTQEMLTRIAKQARP